MQKKRIEIRSRELRAKLNPKNKNSPSVNNNNDNNNDNNNNNDNINGKNNEKKNEKNDNIINDNNNNAANVNNLNMNVEISNEEIGMVLDILADLQFCRIPFQINQILIQLIVQRFVNDKILDDDNNNGQTAFDIIFHQFPFPDHFPERPPLVPFLFYIIIIIIILIFNII